MEGNNNGVPRPVEEEVIKRMEPTPKVDPILGLPQETKQILIDRFVDQNSTQDMNVNHNSNTWTINNKIRKGVDFLKRKFGLKQVF